MLPSVSLYLALSHLSLNATSLNKREISSLEEKNYFFLSLSFFLLPLQRIPFAETTADAAIFVNSQILTLASVAKSKVSDKYITPFCNIEIYSVHYVTTE